jgi:hypothetical protein
MLQFPAWLTYIVVTPHHVMRLFLATCVAAALFLAQSGRALGGTAITSIVIDGQTNVFAGTSPSITVPAEVRLVEIHYSNLDITQPAEGHFRRRLMGLESVWTDVGNARVASFTGLQAGRYTLEVEAADSTGAWPQGGSTLAITVEPRVKPRNLAMLGAMLLALLGIACFFFMRKERGAT